MPPWMISVDRKQRAGSRGTARCTWVAPESTFLTPAVQLCTAACISTYVSFTIDPHPDVGEGAGPPTGFDRGGLFICPPQPMR